MGTYSLRGDGVHDVQAILPTGSVVRNRYIIEDLLGRGGFGAVYLVRDQRVKGNLFALKEVIDASKPERDRFTFEGEVLKRMDHPALPRVYRVFEDDTHNRAYLLMDYIEGPNLEMLRMQQPEKRFSLQQVMTIMSPIVAAANYLHKQRPPIIHRDIKPANIIVPNSGDDAVLVDFGIAKEYDEDSTTTAIRHCSPGYGAPEQYARGTNTRTDIYGLAATFYALLTGNVPTDALYRMTQLSSKGEDPLEPVHTLVPAIPVAISDILQKAMSINSSDRFATVDEFWQALNAEHARAAALAAPVVTYARQANGPITPVPIVPADENATTAIIPKRPPAGRKRRRSAIALLLLALALVALGAGILLGTNVLPNLSHPGQTATTPPATGNKTGASHTPTVTHTTPTAASTPTSQPTATPKPTTAPTNTPVPVAVVPKLAGLYQGTISDQITSPATTDTMTLSQIKQNNTAISGYFAVGGNLQGSGPFTGTVDAKKNIQFQVPGVFGNPPLQFFGKVQADGSLAGNYCSYQNNACDYHYGFGIWRVSVMPSSSIINPQEPAIASLPTSLPGKESKKGD